MSDDISVIEANDEMDSGAEEAIPTKDGTEGREMCKPELLLAQEVEENGTSDPFSAMLRRPSSFGTTNGLLPSPSFVCTKRARLSPASDDRSQVQGISPTMLHLPTRLVSDDVCTHPRKVGEQYRKKKVKYFPRSEELHFDPLEPSETMKLGDAVAIDTFRLYMSDLMQQIELLTTQIAAK